MAPLSNVLKTTVYLFVVASCATLIGYYRLVSIESAHLTARVQLTNEQDQASHHESVQHLKEAAMNITKAGFAASLGKDWDFQSRRVVEWPDPLVSKFEFNRGSNSSRPGKAEVVIAMNRKSLSASNFAFAKSKTRGEQSLVSCLPGGREQLAPLFDILPREDPFRGQKFGSCAVVGNSGILARSGCGAEIDAHDVVFRINEGRTGYSKGRGGFTATARAAEKFSIDVGSKTTLRMILGELATKETEETSGSNALYMDPPGAVRMLAWPCPQGEGHTAWVQQSHVKEKILRTIAGIRKDKRQDKQIMFLSPEPLLQLRRALALSPNTPDPSLGLQIAAVAMNLCGRVSLYGFNRTSNPYHYWDEKDSSPSLLHPFAQSSRKSSGPSSLTVWSEEDAVMESLGRLCPLVCLQTKKCRKRSDPASKAPPVADTTPAAQKRGRDALAQLRAAIEGELVSGGDEGPDDVDLAEPSSDFTPAPAGGGGGGGGGGGATPASGKKGKGKKAEAKPEPEPEAEEEPEPEPAPAAEAAGGKGKGKLKGRKAGEEPEASQDAAAGGGGGSGGGEYSVVAKFRAKLQQIAAIEAGEVLPPPAAGPAEGSGKKKKGAAAAAAREAEEEPGDPSEEARGGGGSDGGDAPAAEKPSKKKKGQQEAEDGDGGEMRMEEVNPFAKMHVQMRKNTPQVSQFGRDETDDAPVDLPVWGAFGEAGGAVAGEEDDEDDDRPLRREPEEEGEQAPAGKKEKGSKKQKQQAAAAAEEEAEVTAPETTWDEPAARAGEAAAARAAPEEEPEFLRARDEPPVFDQAALEDGLRGGAQKGGGKKRGGRAAEVVRAKGDPDRDVAELDDLDEGPKRPHGLFANVRSGGGGDEGTESTDGGAGRRGGGGKGRGGKRSRGAADSATSTDGGAGRPGRKRGGASDGSDSRGSNFFGEESSAVVSDRGSDGSDASEKPAGRSRRRAAEPSETSGTDGGHESDAGGGGGGFISSLRRKGGRRDGFDPDGYDEHGNPYRSAMLFSGRGRRMRH